MQFYQMLMHNWRYWYDSQLWIIDLPCLKYLTIGDKAFRLSFAFVASNLRNIYRLEIGSDCFKYVNTFELDGLSNLISVKIGANSFTETPEYYWSQDRASDYNKTFYISNCAKLRSISIDRYSFSDYKGRFELRNLGSLRSIRIGTVGSNSRNFYWCSFVIQSINIRMTFESIDLDNLQSITLGDMAFKMCRCVFIEGNLQLWWSNFNRSSLPTMDKTWRMRTFRSKKIVLYHSAK